MEWATILAFVTGAIIPIIANLITAKSKYHYDNKLKQNDIYKKEIRSFYLAKPKLLSAYSILSNMNNNKLYDEHKFLLEEVEGLKKIPLDEIPLPIFELYYKCLGNLEYLASNGDYINDENSHVYTREAFREVHVEEEEKVTELINQYQEYINQLIKKLD